ncbi:hypothetical protein VSDG_04051 [Cytospora chrysosperma]|uniref:Erythromycin biosynthesis protein CIII-like C-terminal domain-containing protein n=1 Tax=Cytospora chrysosperma TaxID=252740 RepID=A0A423W0Y2_CYTCH|nr:hypothetical protein VSDG_04051 [Valsa sordida]
MAVKRQSLLFFTNPEWGQANVILATIHEFLVVDDYDIHLASYASLQPRLHGLFSIHAEAYPRPLVIAFSRVQDGFKSGDDAERPSITFHTIPGLSTAEACYRDGIQGLLPHKPGLKGAVSSYRRLQDFFFHMTGEEYMEQERYAKDIITQVQPAVIIAEQGLSQALDACYELKRPFVILSPNSFKDFEQLLQPRLGVLWKYPALASAFPFPVPGYLVPANLYLWVRMSITIASASCDESSRLHKINNVRHACGLWGPPPVMSAFRVASRIICPSLPELDFPMRVRPTTFGCGPIALPKRPVSEIDPHMDSWLRRKGMKTLLVNLGTHHTMDSMHALEIARALEQILDRVSDLQVLWKIVLTDDGQQKEIEEVFGLEMFLNQRIRLERWLRADPVALLDTGKVIAQVHHGGANTYFECCRSGVPQVILASWWDTYEYAARVEYLGVGVFANKKSAPRAETKELREAILNVMMNPEVSAKANELALVCQQNGEGRVRARDLIVDILRT